MDNRTESHILCIAFRCIARRFLSRLHIGVLFVAFFVFVFRFLIVDLVTFVVVLMFVAFLDIVRTEAFGADEGRRLFDGIGQVLSTLVKEACCILHHMHFRCITAGKVRDEAFSANAPRSASRLPAASHDRLEKTHDNAVSFIVTFPAGLGDASFDEQALCRIALQPFI